MMQRGIINMPILIILIVAALASYFFYTKYTDTNEIINLYQTASTNAKPPISSTSAETANWKTYVSAKYYYSIKYPADKFINCSKDENEFRLYGGAEGTRECALGEESPVILLVHSQEGIGVIDKSLYPECYSRESKAFTLNNTEGIKYTTNIIKDDNECAGKLVGARNSAHIILNHNNVPYIFDFSEYTNQEIKSQILSTFKFTQ